MLLIIQLQLRMSRRLTYCFEFFKAQWLNFTGEVEKIITCSMILLRRLHGRERLSFVCIPCWNGRSYSTQTTMKRTNFSRRFDKPDLNFQKKIILTAKAQAIFRNHNPHQNCRKL